MSLFTEPKRVMGLRVPVAMAGLFAFASFIAVVVVVLPMWTTPAVRDAPQRGAADTAASAPAPASRIDDEDRQRWSDYGARQSRFHSPDGLDHDTEQRQLGQCMGALSERYGDEFAALTPLQQGGALVRCLEHNFGWTDAD